MSVKGAANPTYADVAARLGADGKIAKTVIELMSKNNPIMQDATLLEANNGTNHDTIVRSALPSVAWRQYNQGVPTSKSRTQKITEASGMLEAYAEVDKDLADLNGNTEEFRMQEDQAFLESMNQEFENTMVYGDQALSKKKFTGWTPRFNSLTAESGQNIITGGGSGSDNTSIHLDVWSPLTSHLFYPKGSKAGIQHDNKGQVTLEDADGNKYEGYRSHYKLDVGYALRDWRYHSRGANIDVSELTSDASAGAKLIEMMIKMRAKIPNLGMGRAVFYVNQTVETFLYLQMINKGNVQLALQDLTNGQGKILTFLGTPIRRCDAILNTEAAVS